MRHPIDQKTHQYITFLYVYCFYFYLQTLAPSNPFLLFFLRPRDVLRRSRWPADPRTTLRALALMGSLPDERSSDLDVLHRRTGRTGYPDRSKHRCCNCAVAHRAIKRIVWRQHFADGIDGCVHQQAGGSVPSPVIALRPS